MGLPRPRGRGAERRHADRAWLPARPLLSDAVVADLDDTQGGTTGEGIQLGAMASTVDLLQRCYTGLATHDETLWFNPTLPPELKGLRFDVWYRGQRISVSQTADQLRLQVHPCASGPVRVGIDQETRLLSGGASWVHHLDAS